MNGKTIKIIILVLLGIAAIVMLFLAAFRVFKPARPMPEDAVVSETGIPAMNDPASTLYISEDAGGTWRGVPGARMEISHIRFTASAEHAFIGTVNRGVWQAPADTFAAAESIGMDESGFVAPNAVVFASARVPGFPNGIYAVVEQGGRGFLVRRTDGAWRELFFAPLEDTPLRAIAVDPFYAPRILVAGGTGLYTSEDAGETWRAQHRFRDEIFQLVAHPYAPGRYFVTTKRGAFFRTSDYGKTWEEFTRQFSSYRGSRNNQALYVGAPAGSIYLTSDHGLLVSYNDGASWSDIPLIVPPDSLPVTAFAAHSANYAVLYIAADSQLYKSTDGGRTWKGQRFVGKGPITYIAIHPAHTDTVALGFSE